jgi:hypothetical protein
MRVIAGSGSGGRRVGLARGSRAERHERFFEATPANTWITFLENSPHCLSVISARYHECLNIEPSVCLFDLFNLF